MFKIDQVPLAFKFKLIHDQFVRIINLGLKEDRLTNAQMELLIYLKNNSTHDVTQKEICESMHVTHPTVIGLIDRLEDKNLVQRHTNPLNKRFKTIRLTPDGQAILDKHKKFRENTSEIILHCMSQEETEILNSLLIKVYDNLSKV